MYSGVVLLAERPRVEERQLLAAFAARGIEARLLPTEGVGLPLSGESDALPRLALDRAPATAARVALGALLAAGGTMVVNRPATTRLLADRLALLRHLIAAGVAVPETVVSFGAQATLAAIERLGYPALLLAPQVDPALPNAVVEDRDSAEALVEQRTTLAGEQVVLIQPQLSTPGYTTRLLVAGERVAAVERRALGEGDDLIEVLGDPPAALLALGERLIGRIGSGAYAIDLIETPRGPVVVGAENLLDFRAVAAAGIDIAGAIVGWVMEGDLGAPASGIPRMRGKPGMDPAGNLPAASPAGGGDGAAAARQSALGLLHGLVSIPSVSGDEAAAVEWLCAAMRGLGYATRVDGAGNAVGTRGNGAREIVLLGHIDTVPGKAPARIEDGVLFGRGAVDAKGPLAAFVAAGARVTLPDDVRLTVIGAVGEETMGSPGASWLCANYPPPAACIIGEPSGWDGIVLGYKGSIALSATVTRPMTHSAGPEPTAPERLLAFWNRVVAWSATHNAGAEPGFATLDATLRGIASSTDGLTEAATLEATFRMPPGVTSADVRAAVDGFAAEHGVALAWRPNAEAFRTDKRSPLVAPFMAAIRAAGGTPRLKVKTGTSDMNLVGPVWGCPIVAYGPGDAAYDHTPDEHIALAEYERGIQVLTAAIERIAAGLARMGERQGFGGMA